ncbi:MurR/RpiR family transcriptional regulator [Rossellomorea oryzaecorticis]|jgi:DNA-binding MurR/RpiR family transcriptional regulator|uniref:RpiR family transcriptional regulator n=2 Tax=Rossellomorea TaxID=2837508 RepID=A0A1J6VNV3_9BACI|nr:MurR/RpiR family transcriptional regulator [Rossellomorea aquimaris]OIU67005.1 RpiR family transcriptional regulator [Rossellomorea aquimaris]
MNIDVYKVISGKMPEMSKAQEKIARYILENPNQIPFLTVGKLAKLVNVSDATVVRFAAFLGFTGYPEFQRHIQSSVQQQLTATERLKLSKEVYGHEDQGISQIIGGDIENIQHTFKNLDVENFRKMVEYLLKARRVYIVANRSAEALGVFLHYYLTMILDDVKMLDSIEKNADRLHDLGEEDLVLGISFSRYTKSTVDILRFAKEKKAKTAALTDNLLSPLIQHADVSLTAESKMPAFIDSFTAPLSVINALVIYAAKQKQDGFEKRLDELEEVWERFDVFY